MNNWTPYRHLIYFAFSRDAGQKKLPPDKLQSRAERKARKMLSYGVPSQWIDFAFEWPAVSNVDLPIVLMDVEFSRQLQTFVTGRRHRARQALDRLLLAYFTSGHGLVDASYKAHGDYETIDGSPIELSHLDVMHYAQFFWNWRADKASDDHAMSRYVRTYLNGTVEEQLFEGALTVEDVHVEYGVINGFDQEKELTRLSHMLLNVAKRVTRVIAQHPKDMLVEDAEAFRDLSAFYSSVIMVNKAAREAGGDSDVTLEELITDKMKRLSPATMTYDKLESSQDPREILQKQLTEGMNNGNGEADKVEGKNGQK